MPRNIRIPHQIHSDEHASYVRLIEAVAKVQDRPAPQPPKRRAVA